MFLQVSKLCLTSGIFSAGCFGGCKRLLPPPLLNNFLLHLLTNCRLCLGIAFLQILQRLFCQKQAAHWHRLNSTFTSPVAISFFTICIFPTNLPMTQFSNFGTLQKLIDTPGRGGIGHEVHEIGLSCCWRVFFGCPFHLLELIIVCSVTFIYRTPQVTTLDMRRFGVFRSSWLPADVSCI